jgi:Carboxypeptidase regulatory-like domain
VRHSVAVILLTAGLVGSIACGGTTTLPSPITSATGVATVSFSGVTVNGAPVSTYSEAGFTASAMSGDWGVRADYGSPAPFLQFWAAGGSTVTGEVQVRASGSVYFKSVDLYSSTTPIPYTIKGLKNGGTVFTLTDTLPNTFGNFRTVFNPHGADAIDTLSIVLTNAAEICCRNPMGLDTIVFTSTPATAPITFSLNGQVTDSANGAGIPNAFVSIADGPNKGRSTTTDALGNYILTELQQSGFTVNVSASNYVSQSEGVTLTSNRMLSFELTRQVTTPPPSPPPSGATIISFSGLSANGASVSTYTESGFTVSAASGPWEASTYGNPPPFIQFYAAAGTTVTGEVRLTGGGSAFSFYSVDLYSSTTPILYTITGLRNASPVFRLVDTLPNTFGNFRTVTNPNASGLIDALSIALTNTAGSAGRNPMGLDTLVLRR